jgi:hypothetical protein
MNPMYLANFLIVVILRITPPLLGQALLALTFAGALGQTIDSTHTIIKFF